MGIEKFKMVKFFEYSNRNLKYELMKRKDENWKMEDEELKRMVRDILESLKFK